SLPRRIEAMVDKLPEQLDKAVQQAQHRSQIEQLYNQARQAEEAAFGTLHDWAQSAGLRIRREEGQLVVESQDSGPAGQGDAGGPDAG
ncbi:AAA family ATPase, partial [Comamonas sp. B-9]|uniref:AAA family ATPase n=1 Tax=Comamonas sp. B-9 TaxID=1055192 RepID=UPI0011DD949B